MSDTPPAAANDLKRYPNVEEALVVLLADLGEVGTYVPADLGDRLPFHRVGRFTGADDGITDRAVVGIDTFAGTYAVGWQRAEQVRQRMIAGPHTVTTADGPVVLDRAVTGEAPHEVPWGDSTVRRWVASYTVTLRRPPA